MIPHPSVSLETVLSVLPHAQLVHGTDPAHTHDLSTPLLAPTPLDQPNEGGVVFVRRAHLSKLQRGEGMQRLPSLVLVESDTPIRKVATLQALCSPLDPFLPDVLALFLPVLPTPNYTQTPEGAYIDRTARVDPSARLAPGVVVGPHAVVDREASLGPHTVVEAGAHIGQGAEIGPHCVVGWNTSLGAWCRLEARVVLGGDGFGIVPGLDPRTQQPTPRRLPHIGRVVLGEDVQLGVGCCVDRATVGETRIGAHSRLDNLVHIAHNVSVGRRCLFAAMSGVAGSATLGDDVQVGGQSGIAGHITVGQGARVAARSGVTSSVAPHASVAGMPAIPINAWRRLTVALRRLPEWMRSHTPDA